MSKPEPLGEEITTAIGVVVGRISSIISGYADPNGLSHRDEKSLHKALEEFARAILDNADGPGRPGWKSPRELVELADAFRISEAMHADRAKEAKAKKRKVAKTRKRRGV